LLCFTLVSGKAGKRSCIAAGLAAFDRPGRWEALRGGENG
jgi:hypothetical protein